MHKTLTLALLAVVLIAGSAAAADIGIGAFGGVNIPVLNDLSKQGSDFGVRIPVRLLPLITVEPFFAASSLGDVDETFGPNSFTRDGGKLSAFGAGALFTFGSPKFQLFPFVNLGSYKLTRSGADDLTDVGYGFGLGVGLSPIDKLGVNVRGEFDMMVTDQTSQKFAKVTVGASYSVFSFPSVGGGQK